MLMNLGIWHTCVRLIHPALLLSCVLALMVGCSSRQHARVQSDLPNSKAKIAQLEETPLEASPEIMVPLNIQAKPSPSSNGPIESAPKVDPTHDLSEPSSSGPNGDVFASSGQASPPLSITIPQSTPVPALAKPSSTQGLPFTLSDIFFDYDQYTLHQEDTGILATNAQVLLGRYPKKKILIQGHCDERGTEEYNMALGVRRAQAVKDYLVDLGVPSEKMQVLSYGKEKPFCTQHSWNCWKHNRRSHFVFQ